MSDHISESVGMITQLLVPHGRQITKFPADVTPVDMRVEPDETIHHWFTRVVNNCCDGDPDQCALEENIAIFALLYWDKKTLEGANLYTIVTPTSLTEYYLEGADGREQYLRLDLDYKTFGKPFSHPLPHIHLEGDYSPRFALDGYPSGNVVMDYFEFLYRNFKEDVWVDWAEKIWDAWYRESQKWKVFKSAEKKTNENPFPLIVKAFKENQFGVLIQQAKAIAQLKTLLREAKDKLFKWHMKSEDREIFLYP